MTVFFLNDEIIMNPKDRKKNKENPLVSILMNIIVPVIILTKLAKEGYLGPKLGLAVALLFPLAYGFLSWKRDGKANFISVVGFVSVLLTGVIGIFEFPSDWIAYKEASVPFLIGVAVLVSMRTRFPLVRKILYNEDLLDMEKIEQRLSLHNAKQQMEMVLQKASYLVAASFLLSTVLNFSLAKILIKSPSGTTAFAEELGRMTALSYPVIALPSTLVLLVAMWWTYRKMGQLTGLKFEELFDLPDSKEKQDKDFLPEKESSNNKKC